MNSPETLSGVIRPRPEKVTVTLTIEKEKYAKLHAFMSSDTWEEAERVRKLKLEECVESLNHCVDIALKHVGTSGGRVLATFLASLYNGNRVKVDASDIMSLDEANFEHLMNVLRLRYETHTEPHSYYANGGELFEEIITRWGLEKRRRRA